MLINNIGIDDVLTRFGRWFNRKHDAGGWPSKSIERRLEETGLYYPNDPLRSYMKIPKEQRAFTEILAEDKPLDFKIAENIVFDEYFPRNMFFAVYVKYFILSVDGHKVEDKHRWKALKINNKQAFYIHVRIAHACIEEKWETTKNQILALNRPTRYAVFS